MDGSLLKEKLEIGTAEGLLRVSDSDTTCERNNTTRDMNSKLKLQLKDATNTTQEFKQEKVANRPPEDWDSSDFHSRG